jgi:hypothetical protein
MIVVVRDKGKVIVPIHAVKAYRRSGCIQPLILKVSSRWRSVVSLTFLGKEFPLPFE